MEKMAIDSHQCFLFVVFSELPVDEGELKKQVKQNNPKKRRRDEEKTRTNLIPS